MKDHSPEFEPEAIMQSLEAFDRRTFLKLMGAGLAAAGMTQLGACSRPQSLEKIVPYVRSPEYGVAGLPLYYASALPTRGFASGFGRGVIVESHEGRPTKIEGNALHPSSLGGTDIFMQAAVLQLYDPGRSRISLHRNQATHWETFLQNISDFIAQKGGRERTRIALLTSNVTSPTLASQIEGLSSIFPRLKWFVEDPLESTGARAGQIRALGRQVTPVHDFTKTVRIVSLDSHFLGDEAGAVRYAHDFSSRRRISKIGIDRAGQADMARLYVAESSSSYTGAAADHRLAVAPSWMPRIAAGILGMLLGKGSTGSLPGYVKTWIAAVTEDLAAHRERSIVIAGEYQPEEVHAATYAINALLAAPGNTIEYLNPVDSRPSEDHSPAALTHSLRSGEVDLLMMLDVNPAYTATGDLSFAEVLAEFSRENGNLSLHAGAYVDETAQQCTYHAPLSHALESWSDLRGHDGTASIVQPLIEPFWKTHSAVEMLASLLAIGIKNSSRAESANGFTQGYDLVRWQWFKSWGGISEADRETRWRASLREGIIPDTRSLPAVGLKLLDAATILQTLDASASAADKGIELVFRPDPTIADGFYANHSWLQELPKPLTRVTWGNVALVGPATAKRLGVSRLTDPSRKRVPRLQIRVEGASIELPAWVQPGHPENVITLHLGGGRTMPHESVQRDIGVNVNPLRHSAGPWMRIISHDEVTLTAHWDEVACTQSMQFLNGHDICRSRQLTELSSNPSERVVSTEPETSPKVAHLSLYRDYHYSGYKWGMIIDLSACIGCNACVIACQAENNIPTVGKEQVFRGREMHWLRIDTYFGLASATSIDEVGSDPQARFLPMMCQHCENAPCEVVCPVEATSHSSEGINEMTYNRCVGTRYCSNNCPYKVRRFNFLHYSVSAADGDLGNMEAMQRNPNVTVRSRGVMEKCTYCIQRINRARIDAKRAWAKNAAEPGLNPAPLMRVPVEGASFQDGKTESLPRLVVTTACQQACPAQAIIFGDLNDAGARVTKLKNDEPWRSLNYGILEELNTQPRTSYLERILNPNPSLSSKGGAA